jgi:hypothetical protein
LEPVTSFNAADVKQAFRYLQAEDHIGKVILNLPVDPSTLEASLETQSLRFDPESAYVLVGGLGGLGRSAATWMAERGARRLVFLSRNAGVNTDSDAISRELESIGCMTTMVRGSVNSITDVEETIRVSPAPIKGVLHFAMTQRVSKQSLFTPAGHSMSTKIT